MLGTSSVLHLCERGNSPPKEGDFPPSFSLIVLGSMRFSPFPFRRKIRLGTVERFVKPFKRMKIRIDFPHFLMEESKPSSFVRIAISETPFYDQL